MAEQQTAAAAQPAAAPIPARGTPEWDAYVAKRFDDQTAGEVVVKPADGTPAPEQHTKPAGVPDKFWDAKTGQVNYDAWSKSTAELEKQLTQTRQQKPAAEQKPVEPTPQEKHAADTKAHATKKAELESTLAATKAKAGVTPEEIAAAEKAVKDHGEPPAAPKVDVKASTKQLMSDLGAHLAQSETISDDFYTKFEEIGIDKATLDAHVAGQRALAAQRDSQVKAKAGVTDSDWDQMKPWAEANLTDAEKLALNQTLATGTPESAALALQGLKAKHQAAVGVDPKLVGGKPANTGTGYTSLDEQKAAQADPRYRSNATYRAQVEAKIAASTY